MYWRQGALTLLPPNCFRWEERARAPFRLINNSSLLTQISCHTYVVYSFYFLLYFYFFSCPFFHSCKERFQLLSGYKIFFDWFSVHLTVWFRLEIVAGINSGSRLPDPDYRRS